jgi:hypothetical protein
MDIAWRVLALVDMKVSPERGGDRVKGGSVHGDVPGWRVDACSFARKGTMSLIA